MTAAKVSVNVKLDPALLNPYLTDVTDASALRAARITRDRVRENMSPHRLTGEMERSVTIRQVGPRGLRTSYAVLTTNFHAIIQEKGRGPVVPVRAKFLRFKPRGSAVFVFAKRVKGVAPGNFFKRAYAALRLEDFLP